MRSTGPPSTHALACDRSVGCNPAMQIALITSPSSVPGESALCNQFAAAGLNRLHLRKPSWNRVDAAKFLAQLEPRTLQTVVLHSWHELAADYAVKVWTFQLQHKGGCKLYNYISGHAQGIHYSEKTRPNPPLKNRAHLTVSTAFHDLAQLQVEWGELDYAFLSPIFDSISKENYRASFDTDSLRTGVIECSIPLLALGGNAHLNAFMLSQM